MSETDLVAELKASLSDAAGTFESAGDADFKRHLAAACDAFACKRSRTKQGSITLTAATALYATPTDLIRYQFHLWGTRRSVQPWDACYPGPLPRVRLVEGDTPAERQFQFDPAPTAAHLQAYGAEFLFTYTARHALHASDGTQSSVVPADRGLLLLRAQAEAMRELAIRGAKKPVQLRDGYAGTPRNSTPSALYQALLDEFERAA